MPILAPMADRRRQSSRSLWLILFALAACEGAHPANAQPPATSPAVASTAPPSDTAPAISRAPSAAPTPAESLPPPAPAPLSTARPALDPPVACGRKAGDRIEHVPWPHGSGNAKCDALETLWANVPNADLTCSSDDECTIISSDGNCILLPLTRSAAARAEYKTPPCGNPMSGACPGGRVIPRCVGGCCAAR
jgi:type IV secretory pathway VirB10-like protein